MSPHKLPAIEVVLKKFPMLLQQQVEQYWEAFQQAVENASLQSPDNPDFITVLFKVWAFSDFVAQGCIRQPEMLIGLLDSGELLIDYDDGYYKRNINVALAKTKNDEELGYVLRHFRQREMMRIAWRDLSGWAQLNETLCNLSALADACIVGALEKCQRWQEQESGVPTGELSKNPQSLVVLGMGKLGARELNFSSDIDLIFSYPEAGKARKKRCVISNEEFFVSLGQRLIKVLDEITDEGFVFRVDMRLRPYGESGVLVMSFAAMEEYYQSQGREWERYAMIKARPVAGDRERGHQLMKLLRPFVYRRYLDYGAFESLREMKAMINREVERKSIQNNVKLGPGGIREVEFIGQAFQLIRGGRETELQERSILKVLDRLAEKNYLPDYVVRDLCKAYEFLRRVENRLQAVADEQTHELPDEHVGCARLALSMGFENWTDFSKVLASYRQHVEEYFEQVFSEPQALEHHSEQQNQTESGGVGVALWDSMDDEAQAISLLESAGFETPSETLDRLKSTKESSAYRHMSTRSQARMERLMPLLLEAVCENNMSTSPSSPGVTLARVLDIIDAIARRAAYLSLLVENPMALSQLIRLCAASPWIAELLTRQPVLFDELLDPRTLYTPLTHQVLTAQLNYQLKRVSVQDLEQQMDVLRVFKESNVLRVAAADVMDAIPLMVVSDYLTEIAEVALSEVLQLAIAHFDAKNARPEKKHKHDRRRAGFAIVAYGKLGGIEFGYGSDLDLVFLDDDVDEEEEERSLYYIRLGQRIIHMLNTHTPAGILYDVDMRLRPSGASGLLVSGLTSFREYQNSEAWTWEHQALVRARVVVGDEHIKLRFDEIRQNILSRRRDPDVLRNEVCEMRERMREELSKGGRDRFDIKQDRGGIADIEFLVQYGVLRWACDDPGLLVLTDNIRLLQTLGEAGFMSMDDVNILSDAYRAYRARVHQLVLQESPAIVEDGEFLKYPEAVTDIWHRLMIK